MKARQLFRRSKQIIQPNRSLHYDHSFGGLTLRSAAARSAVGWNQLLDATAMAVSFNRNNTPVCTLYCCLARWAPPTEKQQLVLPLGLTPKE